MRKTWIQTLLLERESPATQTSKSRLPHCFSQNLCPLYFFFIKAFDLTQVSLLPAFLPPPNNAPPQNQTQQITPSPHSPGLPASKSRSQFCGRFWVSVHSTSFSHTREHTIERACACFPCLPRSKCDKWDGKITFCSCRILGDGGFVGFTCELEDFGVSGLCWFLGGFPGVENRRSFTSLNKFLLCGLQIIYGCCDFVVFHHRRQVEFSYWMLRVFVGCSLPLSRIFFWALVSLIWSPLGWVLVLQIALLCRLLYCIWAHLMRKSTRRLKEFRHILSVWSARRINLRLSLLAILEQFRPERERFMIGGHQKITAGEKLREFICWKKRRWAWFTEK